MIRSAGVTPLRHVLHVEDDRADARLFLQALSDADVEVVTVGSLAKADEVLAERAMPSLIVVDIRLPDGSGLNWMSRLTQRADVPPVVVFSASTDPFDVRRAYEFGARAFVAKPEGASAYIEVVRHMWGFWRHAER